MISLAQASEIVTEQAQTVIETAHHVADKAEHATHGASHGVSHAVNWVTLIANALGDNVVSRILLSGEKAIFAGVVIIIISIFCIQFSKKMQIRQPNKIQLILESIVTELDNLVCSIIGHKGREYTSFVGSLFIYILVSNLYGLLPLQNSATGEVKTTAALAIIVFLYVQFKGIIKNGFFGYIKHLAGNPNNLMGYFLIPINLPLHVVGEFTKPLSLMFRLSGNVMAGHILVGTFLGMGVQALQPLHVPIGIPMHFPFLFLELLVSVIQALVFSLLTTIYIGMMLPHEDHDHENTHDSLENAAH